MTDTERRILLHTLGLDQSPNSYRNFYLTGPGCTDYDEVKEMVANGLLIQGRKAVPYQGIQEMHYYHATEAGQVEAARIRSIQQLGQMSCA